MGLRVQPATVGGGGGGGSGDVVGPASSTDNAIPRFDGITGKLLKNSGVTINDSGDLSGIGDISVTGLIDGRDVAADGTKLDTIASGAEVNTVDSVNTQTGAVVLDADDIEDSTTSHKFVTAADLVTLSNTSGVNTGDQDLSGLVTGAASSTDNAVPRFDGTSGKTIQNSTMTINDSGFVSINNAATLRALNVTASGLDARLFFYTGAGGNPGVEFAVDSTGARRTLIRLNEEGTLGTQLQFYTRNDSGVLNANMVLQADGTLDLLSNITIAGTVDGRDVAADGTKLDGIESGAQVNTVDTVNGQTGTVVLDSDDIAEGATNLYFTAAEQSKLAGIADGAEVNVNADWNAGSGDAQILNKPTIPTALSELSGDSDDITEGATNLFFTAAEQSKLSGIAAGAEVNPDLIPQAEAEAGTATTERVVSAERLKQAIEALAPTSTFVTDNYVGGVDYTAGTTTQLTLSTDPDSEDNTQVYFDGVYQQKNTYSVSGTTITFDAAIPTGTIEIDIIIATVNAGGGGGGAVDSVNGQTGVVVLDADDISDAATTNKFTTAADISKLSGIASGAEVNTIDSDPTGVTGADQVTNVMSLTQSEFDAITPNASTFYIITDA